MSNLIDEKEMKSDTQNNLICQSMKKKLKS